MDLQRIPTPAERAELGRLLVSYDAALVPAEPFEIDREVRAITGMFPPAKITPQEAKLRMAGYVLALADVPFDILKAATVKAIKTHTFMPSAKELLDLCDGLALRHWRRWRVNFLIDKHDREYREPVKEEPLTPEAQAELDAWLRSHGMGEEAA